MIRIDHDMVESCMLSPSWNDRDWEIRNARLQERISHCAVWSRDVLGTLQGPKLWIALDPTLSDMDMIR